MSQASPPMNDHTAKNVARAPQRGQTRARQCFPGRSKPPSLSDVLLRQSGNRFLCWGRRGGRELAQAVPVPRGRALHPGSSHPMSQEQGLERSPGDPDALGSKLLWGRATPSGPSLSLANGLACLVGLWLGLEQRPRQRPSSRGLWKG